MAEPWLVDCPGGCIQPAGIMFDAPALEPYLPMLSDFLFPRAVLPSWAHRFYHNTARHFIKGLTLELKLTALTSLGLSFCTFFSSSSGKISCHAESRKRLSTDTICPSVVNKYLFPDLCTGFSSSNN